jgi:hypothetical protein
MRNFGIGAILALAMLLLAGGQAKADLTFYFQFSQVNTAPDGSVNPPIVGTGTFHLTNDPGNGTFALTGVGPFTMSFTFNNGRTFTDAGIQSPQANTEVVITQVGSLGRRVYFTDAGGAGGAGGPFGGSLDMSTTSGPLGNLIFEPANSGGHDLYTEQPGVFSGNYLGFAPNPEPSSLVLCGIGGIGFAAWRWRRRRVV